MRVLRVVLIAVLMLGLIFSWTPLRAEDESVAASEVWLVTYGPGEIYWQRFGHNAIWIRDPDLGLNHVFNFGFFDFEQENFFMNFLQGRLLYFSAAQPAEREFSRYIDENRSIRAQKLNFTTQQSLEVAEFLVQEVQPENRDYLYDYYSNNCSTRIRDVLDMAMGGALAGELMAVAAQQSWRDHTRRLTVDDFWLYLGLEIVLGPGVDRAINQWEELFIPAELADAIAGFYLPGMQDSMPLVAEDVLLYESSQPPPPGSPGSWWSPYLLSSVVLLFIAWLACRLISALKPVFLVRTWLLLSGLAGTALVYFWFFTDHVVAAQNLNLLVFCPLWLLVVLPGVRKYVGWALLFLSVLALTMTWLPPHQYALDVLAAFLPLNIASGLVLINRDRRLRSGDPG